MLDRFSWNIIFRIFQSVGLGFGIPSNTRYGSGEIRYNTCTGLKLKIGRRGEGKMPSLIKRKRTGYRFRKRPRRSKIRPVSFVAEVCHFPQGSERSTLSDEIAGEIPLHRRLQLFGFVVGIKGVSDRLIPVGPLNSSLGHI